ncbi:DNA topoisomerase (ATP-hydrolyzing) [Hydrogenobaculum sp. Y04AAS1]|uniref:DNA topoisomerase (ATP-hydrolyzing) n=1 Tax=Hydrogenobaculum sp. (strain Y04AAS1) TaxID=380749 RepID=UPI00015BC8B4|nr:DNA topoisomerase (ATP-hydrolyzing) [Hydrogenobaculum sp. Y04AAS1]HCT66540.1 DNA topoisomerase 4 subunit A [Hydrogenobaculum sp.]
MEILEIPIEEEARQSYLDYAMSVIVGRAIPDVRDGLKPVQRRILYAMYEMDLTPDKPFKKCARIVGDTMGRYHPHGDQAIYDALVRMAQDFNLRYPLVIGQGNFGSIDGDPPAAMRYTEAKLSKITLSLLEDIENDTVDFVPNFDESVMEPQVLPAKMPNLLCNGTTGIAVGLATSIPPHNLKEVCDALVALAQNQDITVEELMQYIKGPDFPTGGIIVGEVSPEVYKTGRGQVTVQAKARVEKTSSGREQIIITEIPYMVNKAELIKKIAELARSGKLKEISDLRDESDKEGIRIVIELKRDAKGEAVLKKLYKNTSLRKNFPINMVALVGLEPKLLNLKDILLEFFKHRLNVIYRRTEFFLRKAEERLHIVEGLLICIKDIDKIIETIRASQDTQEAKEKLMSGWNLTEKQAQAILDLRLQRLTSLETSKLQKEHDELIENIKTYKNILENKQERINIFIKETKELADRFKDPRRTFIEGMIKEDTYVDVFVTRNGFVKPIELLEEEKSPIVNVASLKFTEGLFIVSNKGRVYWTAGSEALSGSSIHMKDTDEHVVGAFVREQYNSRLLILTNKGSIKKIPLVEFEYKTQGFQILKLSEGEEVVYISGSQDESEILILTKKGYINRIQTQDVGATTSSSKAIQCIKLNENDEAISVRALDDKIFGLLITEEGYAKKIKLEDIPKKSRTSQGINVLKQKFLNACDLIFYNDDDNFDVLISTFNGSHIKFDIKSLIQRIKVPAGIGVPEEKVIDLKDDKIYKVVSL